MAWRRIAWSGATTGRPGGDPAGPSERTPAWARVAALGGVAGPTAFVAGWSIGAVRTTADYSSVHDAISRLAAVGADSRPIMTAGFVVFGVGLPLHALALRTVVPGPAWLAAAGTGIATLAVAATPLDRSSTVDALHAVAATTGYVTLAAVPLLAARPLLGRGRRALAGSGVVTGVVSSAALALTAADVPTGFFQRLGLTVTDLWIVASALAIATGRLGRGRAQRTVRKFSK